LDTGGNKLNPTTQQFLTEKISGIALKQGNENTLITTSEQFTTAKRGSLMSRRIRALEHRTCATVLFDAHHCWQDRILLNYTRIEIAHKVRKKTFLF